jgi:hypothetical protein
MSLQLATPGACEPHSRPCALLPTGRPFLTCRNSPPACLPACLPAG